MSCEILILHIYHRLHWAFEKVNANVFVFGKSGGSLTRVRLDTSIKTAMKVVLDVARTSVIQYLMTDASSRDWLPEEFWQAIYPINWQMFSKDSFPQCAVTASHVAFCKQTVQWRLALKLPPDKKWFNNSTVLLFWSIFPWPVPFSIVSTRKAFHLWWCFYEKWNWLFQHSISFSVETVVISQRNRALLNWPIHPAALPMFAAAS